ncbi:MAG: GFA family protein [Actinomycetota bacterium]|nr:GFA family protein [Actinomycetota bacterium]
MLTREAACSCGQLRLTAEGDPSRVSMCHCLACQRRTGSAFGIQARFPADRVRILGRYADYARTSDGGEERTFRFCPSCGATVFYTTATAPDAVAVPVGAFADPSFPPPTVSVYESRRHPWLSVPAAIEHEDC